MPYDKLVEYQNTLVDLITRVLPEKESLTHKWHRVGEASARPKFGAHCCLKYNAYERFPCRQYATTYPDVHQCCSSQPQGLTAREYDPPPDLSWGGEAFLKRSHVQAQRLGQVSQVRSFALKHHDVLRGSRNFKFPLIALNSGSMTKRARHILSQRVIAGTMNVQPPFVPDPETQR